MESYQALSEVLTYNKLQFHKLGHESSSQSQVQLPHAPHLMHRLEVEGMDTLQDLVGGHQDMLTIVSHLCWECLTTGPRLRSRSFPRSRCLWLRCLCPLGLLFLSSGHSLGLTSLPAVLQYHREDKVQGNVPMVFGGGWRFSAIFWPCLRSFGNFSELYSSRDELLSPRKMRERDMMSHFPSRLL